MKAGWMAVCLILTRWVLIIRGLEIDIDVTLFHMKCSPVRYRVAVVKVVEVGKVMAKMAFGPIDIMSMMTVQLIIIRLRLT